MFYVAIAYHCEYFQNVKLCCTNVTFLQTFKKTKNVSKLENVAKAFTLMAKSSDEFACLEFCNSKSKCSWMTYFPDTSYCQLYQNCPLLDTEYCENCLSSQSDCIPDEPTCFVNGKCDGIVHHTQPSASAEDCLQLCNSTVTCRWFTFEATGSECILLTSCPTIDESCETCTSGERRCISTASSSSPSTPSSTTTEFTTTTSFGKSKS